MNLILKNRIIWIRQRTRKNDTPLGECSVTYSILSVQHMKNIKMFYLQTTISHFSISKCVILGRKLAFCHRKIRHLWKYLQKQENLTLSILFRIIRNLREIYFGLYRTISNYVKQFCSYILKQFRIFWNIVKILKKSNNFQSLWTIQNNKLERKRRLLPNLKEQASKNLNQHKVKCLCKP